ncbi:hypothetical protein D3C73_1424860 [compost metagenome]
MTPVAASMARPAGRPAAVKEYGCVPPYTDRDTEYADPAVAAGSEDVATPSVGISTPQMPSALPCGFIRFSVAASSESKLICFRSFLLLSVSVKSARRTDFCLEVPPVLPVG